jgi:DNA (cytosine-5)-methyltransferase 1
MGINVRDRLSIVSKYNECYKTAVSNSNLNIPPSLIILLDTIFDNIEKASSGYSNILTCLVCTAMDNKVDPRYHREPKNDMKSPPNGDKWFSGRSISEKVLVEWMKDDARNFRVANSGWQTRTYERPYPYDLNYPENISYIKDEFLKILDYANKNRDKAHLLIAYFFRKEIEFIKAKGIQLAKMAKDNFGNEILITDVISALKCHFLTEKSSHLPVIAVYSIYELIQNEVKSYKKLNLKPMDHHNSADKRTGAIGDIELEDETDVIEAIEVKHNIKIDVRILIDAQEKILTSRVKRYYILTTHNECTFKDKKMEDIIEKIYSQHGCQIIINGVISTINYYLRMCSSPVEFLKKYTHNLSQSSVVTIEQLTIWNEIKDKFAEK